MIKKTVSFTLLAFLALGAAFTLKAQDSAEDYAMWETIMLVPDNTKLKILGENMRKHNQKFHKQAPYTATVYDIATGPNTGKLVWLMGPLKYSHLDNRPGAGGHDEDWRDNVMPYVKKVEQAEYWRADAKLSNTDMLTPDPSAYPVLFTRYWEINIKHAHTAERILKQISDAVKAMDGVFPWGIYYNEFRQGTKIGRHIATVSFMKNWAEMDKDPNFKETYLKLHGENSWDAFIRDTDLLLDDSWDEIWEYNKNLSGD